MEFLLYVFGVVICTLLFRCANALDRMGRSLDEISGEAKRARLVGRRFSDEKHGVD